jgi:membrane protein YdbS with pleckstrin-like domain
MVFGDVALAGAASAPVAGGLRWSGAHLVVRNGAVARDTWIVPVSKLQQVQLRQGPVQRALGLTTVRLTTAGIGGEADIVDLPLAEARALVDDLVARLPALRRRRPPLSVPTLTLPSPHVA